MTMTLQKMRSPKNPRMKRLRLKFIKQAGESFGHMARPDYLGLPSKDVLETRLLRAVSRADDSVGNDSRKMYHSSRCSAHWPISSFRMAPRLSTSSISPSV